MSPSRNIAARAGRWSAQHRKKAIFGWLAFVILAFVVGGKVGTEKLNTQEAGVRDSGIAAKAVYDAFPQSAEEVVLIHSDRMSARDPGFRAVVDDVGARLRSTEGISDVVGPYAGKDAAGISRDGHSALVTFEIPGKSEDTAEAVDASVATVAALAGDHPQMRIEQFGSASSGKAAEQAFMDDLAKAETTSVPITLIILVLAFGTFLAAGIPVLLAMSGVLATFGLIGPLSQIAPVDGAVQNVVLLIGLAVGVDYTLFYLRREREERAAGRSPEAALEAAAATSGRAVLISGITVMIAMGGMYLAGAATFASFASGTILVVAVSMLASLTVLPAVLSKLGDRVDKGSVPGLNRLKRRMADIGIWSRIVDRVLKRPLLSALASGGVLVALAVPAIGLHTETPGIESMPQDLPVVQTYYHLQEAFPSETNSATIVVRADDVSAAPVTEGIGELTAAAAARSDLFLGEGTVELSPDKTVAMVTVPTVGDGRDAESQRALDALRGEIVPSTLDEVAGTRTYVGGDTASTRDFNDNMKSHLPLVFGFVLLASFVLLLVTFRSIVVPIKAIALNLLSVAAAYGVLVLVFQKGWGEGLLGFESTGAIAAWLPLFLFVVLFGLSMDYHVFILSRVREAVDRGMSTESAVAHAIKSTAGVVTSAAAVMVAVFAIFATLGMLEFKQMGVGLAVAILLDATIVRAVLLPATMKLLGERNWWLPRHLDWLPRLRPEAEVVPADA